MTSDLLDGIVGAIVATIAVIFRELVKLRERVTRLETQHEDERERRDDE